MSGAGPTALRTVDLAGGLAIPPSTVRIAMRHSGRVTLGAAALRCLGAARPRHAEVTRVPALRMIRS